MHAGRAAQRRGLSHMAHGGPSEAVTFYSEARSIGVCKGRGGQEKGASYAEVEIPESLVSRN